MFGGDKAFWGVEPLFNVGSFFVRGRKGTVWGDRALRGVESLFNVGSFFVRWRKAGERWKMRWVVHNVRWNL